MKAQESKQIVMDKSLDGFLHGKLKIMFHDLISFQNFNGFFVFWAGGANVAY